VNRLAVVGTKQSTVVRGASEPKAIVDHDGERFNLEYGVKIIAERAKCL
jgi:hypothetical protein